MAVDRVTPELHERVLKRDGCCFLHLLFGAAHQCRDKWGVPHSAYDLHKLTVDHVHSHAGGTRGKRAPSDERHLTAMCAYSNIAGPSRSVREAQRDYLRSLYGVVDNLA